MSKVKNLFQKQAKLKGTVAKKSILKEGFTPLLYVDLFDADTSLERSLNSTAPYLLTFDPLNSKKKGIEFAIAEGATQVGNRVTFTNVLRGMSKDNFDDAGDYTNAIEWTIGTPIGITTDHINWNYLVKLLSGAKFFKNTMNFDAEQNFLEDVNIAYKPAYLTCGTTATTTPSVWAAISDGEFTISIDGVERFVTGLDFLNVGNNDQVAKIIQTALQITPGTTEQVEWNGTNSNGENVPAGMYISRVGFGNEVQSTKLMLLR